MTKKVASVKVERIAVRIGEQVVEMTEAQARELHGALGDLLGKPEQVVAPYVPYVPWAPVDPYPWITWTVGSGATDRIDVQYTSDNVCVTAGGTAGVIDG